NNFAIEFKDRQGYIALIIAAEYSYKGIIKALLKQNSVNINTQDKDRVLLL
ncbi:hypothetical protein BCR34DRAFT_496618, partial [Clohesyomyces aquaticus]